MRFEIDGARVQRARRLATFQALVVVPVVAIGLACLVLSTAGSAQEPSTNVYRAREGLEPAALVAYLAKMEEKPVSIRARPGFSAAMIEAADRVLGSDADASLRTAALLAKFRVLHFESLRGSAEADEQRLSMAEFLVEDPRPEVAREARFHLLEHKAMTADDLSDEGRVALLAELKELFAAEPLGERHLRIASATVRIINRLADDDLADASYRAVGELWAKSKDRELAKYGRKIQEGVERPVALVGKTLELEGTTLDGEGFDWASYRGRVVLVDFWATWCDPCVAQMPQLAKVYEEHHTKGFEMIGISLDFDRGALAKFVEDRDIMWPNLFDPAAAAAGQPHPLAAKYKIEAVPFNVLVDRDGKVVAQNVPPGDLELRLIGLLGAAPEEAPE